MSWNATSGHAEPEHMGLSSPIDFPDLMGERNVGSHSALKFEGAISLVGLESPLRTSTI